MNREALINTLLQRGDCARHRRRNRFNGFRGGRETVKTVLRPAATSSTPLKQGVNETSRRRHVVVLPLLLVLASLVCGINSPVLGQQPVAEFVPIRFQSVDVYLNSGSAPLAAYQLDFSITNGVGKIVGIEGGEHTAFREAPFYDPKAIQHERVIIAAFSTESADKLPTGKTRLATIHLQITGIEPPQFELKLQTAADAEGKKIPATISLEERKPK